MKIYAKTIEPEALKQVLRIVRSPAFADQRIRIMPDVHAGKGCVIGFTATMGDKVVPSVVGVDIGCGVFVVALDRRRINLARLDQVIREQVPAGHEVHAQATLIQPQFNCLCCRNELHDMDRLRKSCGTLGGGNHFIEVDESPSGNKYLLIHSGSRNLGKQVADIYQRKAIARPNPRFREEIDRLRAEGRETEIEAHLAQLRRQRQPNELAYLDGRDADDYLNDMHLTQRFATANREAIARAIISGMEWDGETFWSFHTIHNYVDMEDHIVRKGAVRAHDGKLFVVPINMRDGTLFCVGKGNPDWNYSAPHGAGRLIGRREAREKLTLKEYERSMKDVYTSSVSLATIDEAPMAYKPMEEIAKYIEPTAHIVETWHPIYNFKAGE